MNWRVPFSDLDVGKAEEDAVVEVIRSKWLTMGERTIQFEEAFKNKIGVDNALAVSNCTAALHMAIKALDIGEGDEVILPSLTFVATSNAVLYEKATPVFADIISPELPLLDPVDVESKITSRTKAIIVMHYAGYPCDMSTFRKIADDHGLSLIEDAAHAPGASIEDRPIGTWGDISCFSFFSNKNIAVGEGGMVCTNSSEHAKKLRSIRSHGMTTITLDRYKGHAWSYDVVDTGFNYRIDEMRSAIGLVQLEKLSSGNKKRELISNRYREAFCNLANLTVPFNNFKGISAFHIFPLLLDDKIERESFMEHMRENGVQTSIHYPPIHLFRNYQAFADQKLPKTVDYAHREVTLPLFTAMRDEQVEIVVNAVTEFINKRI